MIYKKIKMIMDAFSFYKRPKAAWNTLLLVEKREVWVDVARLRDTIFARHCPGEEAELSRHRRVQEALSLQLEQLL